MAAMAGAQSENGPEPTSAALVLPALAEIPHLSDHFPGLPSYPNPLKQNPFFHPTAEFFLSSSDAILRRASFDLNRLGTDRNCLFLRAGPRPEIVFKPENVRAAIVTCGGLCPGMNTVIRELVIGLSEIYGVKEVFGVKAGFRGFYAEEDPVVLDPIKVHDWHEKGGTMLETSRGGFDLVKIMDGIVKYRFNQLYLIGGDGTMRGAVKLFDEICRRHLPISVCGIPKTVDNDIGIIDRSFGFQTAVEIAQQAINAAHVEAESAVNGVGLVKLMGRSTGHIALHATLASCDVDCCLIPESDFYVHGHGGLFEFIDQRLQKNGHAVIVVAESAGQTLIPRTESQKEEKDESGNPIFLNIGSWLKTELRAWWAKTNPNKLFTVKYIDPTYMIRAVPANAMDNMYCTLLAHSAVHGVMAGYTGFVAGLVNYSYAYIPLKEIAEAKNVVDPNDHKWAWVRLVTNQPDFVRT